MLKKTSKLILIYILLITALFIIAGCENAASIQFTQDTYVIAIGEELTPDIKLRPKRAEYDFLTLNPTILSLNFRTFKGLKEGATEITVASGDKTDTAIVVVLKEKQEPSNPGGENDLLLVAFITEWSGVPSQRVKYGGLAEEPKVAAPDGYVLEGFYKDKDYTEKYLFNTAVYEDTYIYIKWKVTNAEFEYSITNGQAKLIKLKYPLIPYTHILIPSSINGNPVTELGDNLLNANKTVEEITVPESVMTIGKNAFTGCTNLKSVKIEGDNLRIIKEAAFGNCTSLTKISLPDSITSLESRVFSGCSKLSEINIPNKITRLSDELLSKTAITSVSLKNIEVLGFGVFLNCKSLAKITDYGSVATKDYPNVDEIDARCFEGTKWFNNQLSASLPSSEAQYKGGVYLGDNLLFMKFDAYNRAISIRPNTKYIARGAIITDSGFVTLESKTPPRAERMFISADANGDKANVSENLRIIIPDENKYKDAFIEQENKLYVANDLGINGMEAYQKFNDRLKYVIKEYHGEESNIVVNKTNATILSIETAAFYEKEKLETIIFNVSRINEIKSNAFNRCLKLEKVIINSINTPPTVYSTSFNMVKATFKVLVPESVLETYKTSWGKKETRLDKIV